MSTIYYSDRLDRILTLTAEDVREICKTISTLRKCADDLELHLRSLGIEFKEKKKEEEEKIDESIFV